MILTIYLLHHVRDPEQGWEWQSICFSDPITEARLLDRYMYIVVDTYCSHRLLIPWPEDT